MQKLGLIAIILVTQVMCVAEQDKSVEKLRISVKNDKNLAIVKEMALNTIKEGFDAGSGYANQVFIRDYNTFISVALVVNPPEEAKENLLLFFKMQEENGSILDVITPREMLSPNEPNLQYRSSLAPEYAGDKATVETDQESSLIQAVYKYVKHTDDKSILLEKVGDKTVKERMELAIEFLLQNRYSDKYGLIYGATTIDWGDVQPESSWGVYMDDKTNLAIDIYDNAMLIVALNNLFDMVPESEVKFGSVKKQLVENVRKYLWDSENNKFIPHLYLDKSPFPESFNEQEVFYFGGTAVAIEAGILSADEVLITLKEMEKRMERVNASSIGLSIEPAYPKGFIKNPQMEIPYTYQNGGDWTWFGARMVKQLVRYAYLEEAYKHLTPLVKRVVENDDFMEWYTLDNQARGSEKFKGSAGVLYDAIIELERSLDL